MRILIVALVSAGIILPNNFEPGWSAFGCYVTGPDISENFSEVIRYNDYGKA